MKIYEFSKMIALKPITQSIPGYRRVRYFYLLFKDARLRVLAKMPKNSVCAEIGVDKGGFSQKILENVKPTQLHLIDPWEYQEGEVYKDSLYGEKAGSQDVMNQKYYDVCNRFSAEIKGNQIVVHRGYSAEQSQNFPDEYFDWIYIDGNHLYEYVKQDLESYYSKVKKGGYIAGDDYGEGRWWHGGVKKAVDEFVASGMVKLIRIDQQQFILQK